MPLFAGGYLGSYGLQLSEAKIIRLYDMYLQDSCIKMRLPQEGTRILMRQSRGEYAFLTVVFLSCFIAVVCSPSNQEFFFRRLESNHSTGGEYAFQCWRSNVPPEERMSGVTHNNCNSQIHNIHFVEGK